MIGRPRYEIFGGEAGHNRRHTIDGAMGSLARVAGQTLQMAA
jgi:hypothetical protein